MVLLLLSPHGNSRKDLAHCGILQEAESIMEQVDDLAPSKAKQVQTL